MKQNNEALEQKTLMQWAEMQSGRYPELALLYHIPNGGSRNKAEAANLKMQGVKSGVPDLHLPVARGRYHSLYIEMKYGHNRTTENQNKWISELKKQGNAVMVCYGWEEAVEVLKKYLDTK